MGIKVSAEGLKTDVSGNQDGKRGGGGGEKR